jgi:hypothetical protein
MKDLLKEINYLEKLCISKDCGFTTMGQIRVNGIQETLKYYKWLCRQTPALYHTCFDHLANN